MRRLALILIVISLLAQPALAQGPGYQVYLPIVTGGNMGTFATLQISDGTTTIDLLHGPIYLTDWTPSVPQSKGGGVWQDSPLATGRRLVDRRFGNVTDSLTLDVSTPNQDDTIRTASDLFRLLEKARDFSASGWQSDPVWIKRQAACETSPTYALIFDYRITDMGGNPYTAPFFGERSTLNAFALILEHSIWLGSQPGTGECVQASGVQVWQRGGAWSVITAAPTTFVYDIKQMVGGRVIATDTAQIWYSDDSGLTWNAVAVVGLITGYSLLQTQSGKILMGDSGQIWASVNDGLAWAVATAAPVDAVVSLIQLASGRILAGEMGQVWASDDDGVTWAVITTKPVSYARTIIQTTSRKILLGEFGQIWKSTDNGVSWSLATTAPSGEVQEIIQTSSGRILAGENSRIWSSTDDGVTWGLVSTLPTTSAYSLGEAANRTIYAGDNGNILMSTDDGLTWSVATTLPAGLVESICGVANGNVLAGEAGNILLYPDTSTNMGAAATCDDGVFLANKQNVANLTHIFVSDGGVFGANLLPIVAPATLLPAVPAVGDYVAFGIDTTIIDSGPFDSLVFYLSSIITYDTSYTITWEYVSAVGPGPGFVLTWSALTVQDGTNPGTGAFRNLGVSSVHWAPPAGWVDTGGGGVNGITGWWVRARVSALVGTITPPVQASPNIYSIVLPYADVAASQVSGDIPALARLKLHNRSDADGRGGNAPNLWDNRIVAGLRSYDRGPTFTAFLNASNEQNPAGVTVTLGANTNYSAVPAEMIMGITGQLAIWSAVLGDTTFVDRITFTLGSTIARDYYGAFHAFLRASVTAGASSDIHARLQVRTGSGGVTFTSSDDYLKGTTDYEVLDLGRVTIPASGVLSFDDLGDSTVLAVQFRNDSGAARTVYIHDLILIPVDEWQMDAVDMANITASVIGRQSSTPHLLDIDSLAYQKVDIRTPVRTADANGFVTAIYLPNSPGPAILQANARQRLWVFAMRTSATGATYNWLAEPWIAHSIQIWANFRYLGYRGDR